MQPPQAPEKDLGVGGHLWESAPTLAAPPAQGPDSESRAPSLSPEREFLESTEISTTPLWMLCVLDPSIIHGLTDVASCQSGSVYFSLQFFHFR